MQFLNRIAVAVYEVLSLLVSHYPYWICPLPQYFHLCNKNSCLGSQLFHNMSKQPHIVDLLSHLVNQ